MIPSTITKLDAALDGGFPTGCVTNFVCSNPQLRRELYDWMAGSSPLQSTLLSTPKEGLERLGNSTASSLFLILDSGDVPGKRLDWWRENGAAVKGMLGLRAWVGFSGSRMSYIEERLSSLTIEVIREGRDCRFLVLQGRYSTRESEWTLPIPSLQCTECNGTGISGDIFGTRCWKCGGRQSS